MSLRIPTCGYLSASPRAFQVVGQILPEDSHQQSQVVPLLTFAELLHERVVVESAYPVQHGLRDAVQVGLLVQRFRHDCGHIRVGVGAACGVFQRFVHPVRHQDQNVERVVDRVATGDVRLGDHRLLRGTTAGKQILHWLWLTL